VSGGSARLGLIGSPTIPAWIAGLNGGGYSLTVTNGATIAASNYRIGGMGASGIVITDTALIETAPNDLRGGRFDNPSATAGSCLLDIEQPTATELRYIEFDDTLGVGTYNVRTAGSAKIILSNAIGNFSGETYEDDTGDLIDWDTLTPTTVEFTARNGPEEVELSWTSSAELDIDKYILEYVQGSPSNPFTTLLEVTPTGAGSSYGTVHNSLTPDVIYNYQLWEELTHGARNLLATATAVPYSASLPANVLTVGSTGTYSTIDAAISAASAGNSVIVVQPGTYDAFTISSSAPAGLRIIGDVDGIVSGATPGSVVIDTSTQAVEISGISSSGSVEMSDLEIGSTSSGNEGVSVVNCSGVVLLDELVVHGGGTGLAGVRVDESDRTVVQRSQIDGDPGLLLENASTALISRGSLDELELADSSFLRLCELSTTSTVGAGSTLIEYVGVMPDLDIPEFVSLQEDFTVTAEGAPGDLLVLLISTGLSFGDAPGNPKLQMAALASLSGNVTLFLGDIPGGGTVSFTSALPASGLLLGVPIVMQPVTKNTTNGVFRFGSGASIVGLP
jgi:hypothetical protein